MISKRKEIFLGMLVLSIFVLIVSVTSLYIQTKISSGDTCGCAIPIPLFIPFIASIGLFIGTLIYYIFSPRLDKPKIDSSLFLNFLDGDEKKVFEIVLNKKSVTQASLVRETKLSKVKVFRVLRKLKRKGLINKEPSGKTNLIELEEEIAKSI